MNLRQAAERAMEVLTDYVEDPRCQKEIDEAAIALRQALAQTEQEPVAWRNTETGEFCTGGFLLKDLAKWTPLYTAPPNKEWVGLTDEEIGYELTKEFGQWWGRHVSVCRAIEAKLKEKNNG